MARRLISAAVAFATATSLVSLGAASAAEPADDPRGTTIVPDASPRLRATGLIVKLKSDTVQRRRALASAVDRALPSGTGVATTVGGLKGMSLVRFDDVVTGQQADALADRVQARSDVAWALPNYVATAQGGSPVGANDPYFAQQRNLWDMQIASPEGGFSTKAPALWRATRGTSNVVVAVLDTGILPDHPDLKGRLVAGYDFVDDEEVCDDQDVCEPSGTFASAGDGDGIDPDPSDPGDWIDETNAAACGLGEDDHSTSSWHGSHVAGIIGATANNGIGIAGVAPGVKVQPVRVIGHCGATLWDIMMGIVWSSGADLGEVAGSYYADVPVNRTPAQVANLSLGLDLPNADLRDLICDEAFGPVASIARSQGTALVAAAGNAARSADLALPAACPGFLSVGAASATGHRAWYSNFGSSVDVSAPGGDQLIEGDMSDTVYSTVVRSTQAPNGVYDIAGYEGTSMAAPAVAGGMALLASMGHNTPDSLDRAVGAAVSPFPARSERYVRRTVTLPSGKKLVTGDLNCTPARCGSGLFDLSRVVAAPTISGSRNVGSVLRARGTGLYGPAARETFTWWRGSVRVGNGPAYRVARADIRRRLTVKHVVTGPFKALSTSSSITVPRTTARVTIALPRKTTKSKRVRMRVQVAPLSLRATGTIRVYDGKKRIASKRLTATSKGRVAVKLPKLRKGKHRIRVIYSGNGMATSAAASRILRVR